MNRSLRFVFFGVVYCLCLTSCHQLDAGTKEDSGTIDANIAQNDAGKTDTEIIDAEVDASKSECVPDTWRCVASPTGRQQCLLDETWGEVEPCDICIGQGDCRVQICVENETSCDNGTLKKCNAIGDAYESEEACPSGICDDAKEQCVGCKPGVDIECDVTRQYLLTCNSNGTFDQTDCWAENKTCDNAECVGECVVGDYRCIETSGDDWGDSQVCDGTGTWQANSTCEKSGYDELCNRDSGLCEDNTPKPVGKFTTSGGSGMNTFNDDLLATPIMIGPNDVWLAELGVVAASDSVGGEVRLVLYTDDNNNPGTPITSTPAFGPTAGSAISRSVYDSHQVLTANTRYWVAVMVRDQGASDAFRIMEYSSTLKWVQDTATYLNPPPSPFPSPDTTNTSYELGLYALVQRFWE